MFVDIDPCCGRLLAVFCHNILQLHHGPLHTHLPSPTHQPTHPPTHPATHQPASHPLPPWGFWNAHMFQSSMTNRNNDWIDDWMYEAMVDSTSCRWWLHHASAMVLGCGCLSESILDVFCAHMFQPIRNESLLSHHLWLFDVRIPTSGKVKKDTSA